MRRAGWKVYLAGDSGGSYEEVPPSLITYAARDRRWCQGNLQHARLLFTPGLHHRQPFTPVRLGVMAYLSSPLWLLLLLLSTIEGLRENLYQACILRPRTPHALFPIWQISIAQQAVSALLPCHVAAPGPAQAVQPDHSPARCRTGGSCSAEPGLNLPASAFLEILFSTLLAPVLALLQTRFVATILMGKKVRWDSQERGETGTTFGEALRRHRASTLLGLAWGGALLYAAPEPLLVVSPRCSRA